MVRRLLLLFGFLSLGTLSAQTPVLSEVDIIRGLRKTALTPETRNELVLALQAYPSEKSLDLLLEVIALDADSHVVLGARKVYQEMKRFLNAQDRLVLEFRADKEDYSLRATEFQTLLASVPLAAGEPESNRLPLFLKTYLSSKFLELELEKEAGTVIAGPKHMFGAPRRLKSKRQVFEEADRESGKILQEFIKPENILAIEAIKNKLEEALDYSVQITNTIGREKLRNYLWRRYLEDEKSHLRRQLLAAEKEELLNLLISERASSFVSPREVREEYEEQKLRFQDWVEAHPFESAPAEAWWAALKKNPAMRFLLKPARTTLRGVRFSFPSISGVKKTGDEKLAQSIQTQTEAFYGEVLSEKLQEWAQKKVLSLFTLEIIEPSQDEPRKDPPQGYIERIRAEIDKESQVLARLLVEFKGALSESFETKVKEAIDFLFSFSEEELKRADYEVYPPAVAMNNALEIAIGRFQFNNQETMSDHEKILIRELMWFVARRLKTKMQDLIFDHLETRRKEFETLYTLILERSEPKNAFLAVSQELHAQQPTEVELLEERQIAQGERLIFPQLETWSFGERKKGEGEIDSYYAINDPDPSIAIFQWGGYEPASFVDLSEEVEGRWVGAYLMSAIRDERFRKVTPDIEKTLFRKYIGAVSYFGLFEDPRSLEELLGDF